MSEDVYCASGTVTLDRSSSQPLFSQVADAVREAIRAGSARAGTRLPASRALAADLSVARGVVAAAYDQLAAEGWVASTVGSGTYVADIAARTSPPRRTVAGALVTATESRIELRPGLPWTPPRASEAWRRAWREVGTRPAPALYPDGAGERSTREAIAHLLGRARGMSVDPESVVVTTGTSHGLGLVLDALAGRARTTARVLAIETPGYRAAADTALLRGWSLHDLPVDPKGVEPDSLAAAPNEVAAVYLTPSHQYPTGGFLPIDRRLRLADIAVARDLTVIEDDYDSEFRYDVAPLPPLVDLAPDHVVYLGTVAKTLGAGVRLGWVVAPPHIVGAIVENRTATGDFPSVPVQYAIENLLRDGEWDRAVRAARRRYRARDAVVASALSEFGELRGLGAGMHTTLMIDPLRAATVSQVAARAGVDVRTVAATAYGGENVGGLVIGFGRIHEHDLHTAMTVLRKALRAHP